MSGIEIAGLVLGGFPLLISTAEHYRKGFEPLAKWYKFRTQFIAFIDAVDIQKQLFNLTLECFLRSIGIEEDELEKFMDNGGYEGWQRPELFQRLRTRLGPSLQVFKSTIKTMNGLMHELETLLLIKDGQVEWLKEGSSRMDYQMYRLRHSFSKKGTRAVESLKAHNDTLRHLLESTEKLSGLKAKGKKDTTWANVFEAIRRHASSVHAALSAGWSCKCAPHTASLRLEQRKTGNWDSSFSLAFGVPQDMHTIVRREVTIKARKQTTPETGLNACAIPQKSDISDEIQAGLNGLRREFQPGSTSQIKVASRPPLSTPTSTPPSSYLTLKSLFRNSSSNGTDCLVEESHIRTLPTKRPRPPKQTRFDGPIDLHVRVIPAVVATPAPHVPQTVQSIQLSEIKDLCSMIRAPVHNQCIGYLCDGDQLHDVLPLPVPGPGLPETETYITLSDIKQDVCQLSTQKRIKLAAILASSLLQLQTTPWLVGSFEKENIFFYRRGQEVCLDHPYVRHAFTPTSSCNTQSEPEIRLATRTSLDNLGILLLELCFGKPIETTKIRERYLVDGKPHQGTDYMTAREWVDSVWEEEPKLESIIKTCLFHPFEEKPDWRNKLFTQAVYVSVVGPLDDYFVTKWP